MLCVNILSLRPNAVSENLHKCTRSHPRLEHRQRESFRKCTPSHPRHSSGWLKRAPRSKYFRPPAGVDLKFARSGFLTARVTHFLQFPRQHELSDSPIHPYGDPLLDSPRYSTGMARWVLLGFNRGLTYGRRPEDRIYFHPTAPRIVYLRPRPRNSESKTIMQRPGSSPGRLNNVVFLIYHPKMRP